jgi:hypothetical protein
MRRNFLAAATILASLVSAPAFAGTVDFSDGTFNLGNYSASPAYSADPSASIAYSQCATCGDPDQALQFIATFTSAAVGTPETSQGLVNILFAYNPSTQGDITSIGTSVDKNIFTDASGTAFGNTYHPTIEQDGVFYVASIAGSTFDGPNTPGGTGYTVFSGDLTASDFLSYDFAAGISGLANPNFDGDTMLFGLTQMSGIESETGTLTTQYDNLDFTITNNVPEPFTLSLFGAGLAGAAALRRRKKVSTSKA